jgi:hypothetical protein
MNSTQNTPANIPNENTHVREIKQWDPGALPLRIDQHAGSGWKIFCSWVFTGGTEFVPELDSYTEVANKHARLPEYLRQRLDAVFAGLAREADPNTSYEDQFIGIETEWRHRMRTAALMSKGSSKKRTSNVLRSATATASCAGVRVV